MSIKRWLTCEDEAPPRTSSRSDPGSARWRFLFTAPPSQLPLKDLFWRQKTGLDTNVVCSSLVLHSGPLQASLGLWSVQSLYLCSSKKSDLRVGQNWKCEVTIRLQLIYGNYFSFLSRNSTWNLLSWYCSRGRNEPRAGLWRCCQSTCLKATCNCVKTVFLTTSSSWRWNFHLCCQRVFYWFLQLCNKTQVWHGVDLLFVALLGGVVSKKIHLSKFTTCEGVVCTCVYVCVMCVVCRYDVACVCARYLCMHCGRS